MGKIKNNLKSTCCNSKVKVEMSADFFGDNPKTTKTGTCYYVCTKCHQPCNIYVDERKIWIRNPKTQVQEDNRDKEKNKLTKKEIEETRLNEDF